MMVSAAATPLLEIEDEIGRCKEAGSPRETATALLALGERALECWIEARGETPTAETREGFRLLALHRQGARGEPSFNACRETARELVYHHNLISAHPEDFESARRVEMMAMVARHLCLFVAAKLETTGIGEFCCSSKPLRGGGQ
ncbi:MAG: hypothetical protein F9K44_05030 [Hyphomicrobiaceae bacterium]|nr:MAG: hypothetical protein F9K44_05030 [Hyphomicrobiaceae bacterium]